MRGGRRLAVGRCPLIGGGRVAHACGLSQLVWRVAEALRAWGSAGRWGDGACGGRAVLRRGTAGNRTGLAVCPRPGFSGF